MRPAIPSSRTSSSPNYANSRVWHSLRLSSGDGQRWCGAAPGFIRCHRATERLRLAIIFPPMDIQYNPECEALAAMKLAAEAQWSRKAAMDQCCAGVDRTHSRQCRCDPKAGGDVRDVVLGVPA